MTAMTRVMVAKNTLAAVSAQSPYEQMRTQCERANELKIQNGPGPDFRTVPGRRHEGTGLAKRICLTQATLQSGYMHCKGRSWRRATDEANWLLVEWIHALKQGIHWPHACGCGPSSQSRAMKRVRFQAMTLTRSSGRVSLTLFST
jgi:hypothetical protein